MKRSQFCKNLMTTGIACGCALGFQTSGILQTTDPLNTDALSNPDETPCNEKMDFTQKWIKRFFEIMDQKIDIKTRTELMQANGHACAKGAYSVGYVQYMFQKLITFKPVQVELLESLRGGGKSCRFKVII
jgi:hypothetical protein